MAEGGDGVSIGVSKQSSESRWIGGGTGVEAEKGAENP